MNNSKPSSASPEPIQVHRGDGQSDDRPKPKATVGKSPLGPPFVPGADGSDVVSRFEELEKRVDHNRQHSETGDQVLQRALTDSEKSSHDRMTNLENYSNSRAKVMEVAIDDLKEQVLRLRVLTMGLSVIVVLLLLAGAAIVTGN